MLLLNDAYRSARAMTTAELQRLTRCGPPAPYGDDYLRHHVALHVLRARYRTATRVVARPNLSHRERAQRAVLAAAATVAAAVRRVAR